MTTMKDVAKRAGVSVATVSHVMNATRKVAPETEKRVKKIMEQLDYHPNAVARSLKTQRTHTIGLIVSDISNPFFSTLVRGAEDFAMENGYSLIVCNTDETLSKEKLYIDVLLQKKIDGMVIAPTGKSNQNLQLLLDRNVPVVFVDRTLDGIECDAVLSKNLEGAYQATKHLIEHGHRRIGIIIGLEQVSTSRERLKGYKRALNESDIGFDDRLVVQANSRVQGGKEVVSELLASNHRPSAIFVTNNLMTIGAMQGLKENGLQCPRDLSLIGFDDFEWAETLTPSLTTVAQQPYKIGFEAVKLLLNNIRRERRQGSYREIRIDVKLQVRSSVASPASHPKDYFQRVVGS